jgi:hypothetical protein
LKYIDALLIHHRPIDEMLLKRLILIFDHVHIIDPKENKFLIPDGVAEIDYGTMVIGCGDYGILYDPDHFVTQETRLIDQFDYAVNKGVIRIIDLRLLNFYKKYWLPLRLAYDFDTANKNLLNLSKKLCERESNVSSPDGIIRGSFIEPAGAKIYPSIPNVPNVFTEEETRKYQFDIQSFSMIGKLDRALAVCGEYNLIPAFAESTLAEMLIEKSNMAKQNTDIQVRSTFKEVNKIELQKVQYLLYRISEMILPNEILSQIPIRELVIARNNTFHELAKLRRKLITSMEFLSKHQFDTDFLKEVEAFMTKEFEPLLKDYHSKLLSRMLEFLKFESTFTFGSIGAAIGLSQSLNPLEIAFLSGITASVASAVNNLADYIVKKGKEKFKNSYAYFLNFSP